jgi:hypothetical protein
MTTFTGPPAGTIRKRSLMASMLPAVAVVACLALAPAAPAIAQADQPLAVSGKLVGKVRDGEFKKSEDVSGLACAGSPAVYPRICLLADDETQGAQVVILHQDRLVAGDFIPLIDSSFDAKPLELDAEGVAYADGFFYVIGSHGRPRHGEPSEEALNAARAVATAHVFRIRLDPAAISLETGAVSGALEIKGSTSLARMIAGDATLAPFHDQPLDANGLTIEGVAARGPTLYAGLRGPVLADGSAVIVSAPLDALFEGGDGPLTIEQVRLGTDTLGHARGIRDLVAFDDGFLILAGPVQDPDPSHGIVLGDYAIYLKTGAGLRTLADLKAYGPKTKPEALLVTGSSGQGLSSLILFDGPKEGEPRHLELGLR